MATSDGLMERMMSHLIMRFSHLRSSGFGMTEGRGSASGFGMTEIKGSASGSE
ncbi:MAG: hypothetical protein ABJG41_20270 [Cyclobacteriaceae bacterium]